MSRPEALLGVEVGRIVLGATKLHYLSFFASFWAAHIETDG